MGNSFYKHNTYHPDELTKHIEYIKKFTSRLETNNKQSKNAISNLNNSINKLHIKNLELESSINILSNQIQKQSE